MHFSFYSDLPCYKVVRTLAGDQHVVTFIAHSALSPSLIFYKGPEINAENFPRSLIAESQSDAQILRSLANGDLQFIYDDKNGVGAIVSLVGLPHKKLSARIDELGDRVILGGTRYEVRTIAAAKEFVRVNSIHLKDFDGPNVQDTYFRLQFVLSDEQD